MGNDYTCSYIYQYNSIYNVSVYFTCNTQDANHSVIMIYDIISLQPLRLHHIIISVDDEDINRLVLNSNVYLDSSVYRQHTFK